MILSVIIPVWNLWDMSAACLRSLAQYSPDDLEIIVVDNGSTDATTHALESLGAELFGAHFVRIRLEENRGFAQACNIGAQAARSDWLFFLNNDTILTENWLPPLLAAFTERPQLGMAGPLLLFPNMRVQHCGVTFAPSLGVSHLYEQFPAEHPVIHKRRTLQAISGAAILLSRALFLECGGFFDEYQNGFEDLDLCGTLRQKNYQLACIPDSQIIHHTSQTPGRKDHDRENAALLKLRHPALAGRDLHRFAHDDGFEIAFAPDFYCYLALPPAREAGLNANLASADPARLAKRLNENPLWQGGYTLLAAALESHEDWQQALAVRFLHCHFFPFIPNYMACARTATRANDPAMHIYCLESVSRIRDRMADAEHVFASFNWALENARTNHDTILLNACARWEEKYVKRVE